MYFERQEKQFCIVHAINNCMQKEVLTKADMFAAAQFLAESSTKRTVDFLLSKGKQVDAAKILESTKKSLFTADGDFSVDVALLALKEKGLYAHHGRKETFPFQGRYFLTGEVAKGLRAYGHAVAIVDGLWLDSENNGPEDLENGEMPKYYKVGSVYTITRSPSPQKSQSFLNLAD